jgi:hypothetical protein
LTLSSTCTTRAAASLRLGLDVRRHFLGELALLMLYDVQRIPRPVTASTRRTPAATPPSARDLEDADVAGARHVRAAAQLARGADVQHTHLVAVFLAEQHHGAGLLRVVDP